MKEIQLAFGLAESCGTSVSSSPTVRILSLDCPCILGKNNSYKCCRFSIVKVFVLFHASNLELLVSHDNRKDWRKRGWTGT